MLNVTVLLPRWTQIKQDFDKSFYEEENNFCQNYFSNSLSKPAIFTAVLSDTFFKRITSAELVTTECSSESETLFKNLPGLTTLGMDKLSKPPLILAADGYSAQKLCFLSLRLQSYLFYPLIPQTHLPIARETFFPATVSTHSIFTIRRY